MTALGLVIRPLAIMMVLAFISSVHAQLPEGFHRELLATGLNPTSLVLASDGRLFITEKHGVIRILRDGVMLEDPFLTLEVDDSNERGLGHMVFHPDFDLNGFYYIYYSVPGLQHNRISRFTAIGDKTIPGSETVILELDPGTGEIHNGGDMVFGQDGYLYVATGDRGENWRGEDLGSTNAKLLRIDDEGRPVPDNPWYDFPYLRANLVYAYGLRNPFTLTVHPTTGQIFVNDVGGSKFEEINAIERGAFYGWPKVEGKRAQQVVPAEYRDPVFQYSHQNGYCAIVGSVFYLPEDRPFPEVYHGIYFYGDYCTGHVRMLDTETGQDKGVFIQDGDRIVDMDVSSAGDFYYLERRGLGDGSAEDNTASGDGRLWKVSYSGSGAPFIAQHPANVLASAGERARFTVLASGSPPLQYQWRINGEVVDTATGPVLDMPSVTIQQDGYEIQVWVMNAYDTLVSETAILSVTSNQRPFTEILQPLPDFTYTAGGQIVFSGRAWDVEEGELPADSLSWRIDFHHGTHSHPAMSWLHGVSEGQWSIPSLGETATDVWYRVYLKATDREGLSQITHHDVFPELGIVHVHSVPEGLIIDLDGAPEQTPYTMEGVRGITRHITPPYKQVKGDSVYFFEGWSDGATVISREVMPSESDQVITGRFSSVRNGSGTGLNVYYYDNTAFEGEPAAQGFDSLVLHNYLFKSPHPDIPEDHFGIKWKGYILPYRSELYTFSTFADDAIWVAIDRQVVIQNWKPGFNYDKGEIWLEAGRLYPIEIRLNEYLWSSQISLRWSCRDFPEEVVPTSQLYPLDDLSDRDVSGGYQIQEITPAALRIVTESYREVLMDFQITTSDGITWMYPDQKIEVGTSEILLDIHSLPGGIYYLSGSLRGSAGRSTQAFVKL